MPRREGLGNGFEVGGSGLTWQECRNDGSHVCRPTQGTNEAITKLLEARMNTSIQDRSAVKGWTIARYDEFLIRRQRSPIDMFDDDLRCKATDADLEE